MNLYQFYHLIMKFQIFNIEKLTDFYLTVNCWGGIEKQMNNITLAKNHYKISIVIFRKAIITCSLTKYSSMLFMIYNKS